MCDTEIGTSFYRMRSADNYTQYTKNTEDEMYHIPFDKRYLIGNERAEFNLQMQQNSD